MNAAPSSGGGVVSRPSNATPAIPFRWRDSLGNFYAPEDMETRHLFYTLRMIWNHSMPEALRIEPYRRYRFSSFYTPEFMRQAIRSIGEELLERGDLKPNWKVQLDFMAPHFRRTDLLLAGRDAA